MSLGLKSNVNLKTVADRVGLAPCSVSAVLNNSPASYSIPQVTKEKIFRAATELNYRPNLWARSLRTRRTRMVAVVARDFGHRALAKVVAAAQDRLQYRGYLLVLERLNAGQAASLPAHLQQRGIEGVIAIDIGAREDAGFPVAAVDLSCISSTEMIRNGIDSWLQDLGAAAAEKVMREIESKKLDSTQPEPPSAPFGVDDRDSQNAPGKSTPRLGISDIRAPHLTTQPSREMFAPAPGCGRTRASASRS